MITGPLPSPPPLRGLHARLAAVRVRLVAVRVGLGFANTLLILVPALMAEMALDYLVHLPWLARATITVGSVSWALAILYRGVLLPLARRPSMHAAACLVERALPVFETRLIAAIQLAASPVSAGRALVAALVRETAALAATQNFRKVVDARPLWQRLRLLGGVLIAATLLGCADPGNLGVLLMRALLLTSRLPGRTHILRIDCPREVVLGDDLPVRVEGGGVLPGAGSMLVETGAAVTSCPLSMERGTGRYSGVIHGAGQALKVTIHLGDAESDPIEIAVLTPPVVRDLQCLEIFPAYTGLAPALHPPGDLTLLAGGTLRLTVASGSPIESARVRLSGSASEAPMSIDPADAERAHADVRVPAHGLTGFSIQLVGKHHAASRDATIYHIDVVPDKPPAISITRPSISETATLAATVLIGFRARDDYGIAAIRLHYSVDGGAEKIAALDAGALPQRLLERQFQWELGALRLAPGSTIAWWIEAVDNNDITGPSRGQSEHARIRVVTEGEKRAELGTRLHQALEPLDQLGQGEQDLSRRLDSRALRMPGNEP